MVYWLVFLTLFIFDYNVRRKVVEVGVVKVDFLRKSKLQIF